MNACTQFRSLLEKELTRPGTNAELTTLSWHEHLLSCGACRELLEAEEALEILLGSLPKPQLPADLAKRVLRRLRRVRTGVGLDQLLEVDDGLEVPTGLSQRVLAGLSESRDGDALDNLLDQYTVPADPGLSERVLSALESERGSPVLSFYQRPIVRGFLATAAALLAFFAAYNLNTQEKERRQDTETAMADPALLEDFFLLDNWNLLMPDSDVELLIATSLDPADEIALTLEGDE